MNNVINPTLINYLRWVNIGNDPRPSRTKTEAEKDTDDYAVKCGRYYMSQHEGAYSDWFRLMAAINIGFVTEQLWGMPEDKEMYLLDRNRTTTRRALRSPLMRPMATRLAGQLSRAAVHARAVYSGQNAESGRDVELMKAALFARAARSGGAMSAAMGMARGVDGNEENAMRMAEANYREKFVKPTNLLINAIAQMNQTDRLRKQAGDQLIVSGLAALHEYTSGMHIKKEILNYDEVIWDTACRRPDMLDQEYQGFIKRMSIDDLAERFDPKADVLKELEKAVAEFDANQNNRIFPSGQVPVATIYYKDAKRDHLGLINGPNGIEAISLDTVDPKTKKPKYSLNDCVEPPPELYQFGWTEKVDVRWVKYAREVQFIPYEFMPTAQAAVGVDANPRPGTREAKQNIVLKQGICETQEQNPFDTSEVELPIKMSTWSFINGWIVSPMSAAQSPQRVSNQVTSDITWRMAKGKGSSRLIDKHSVTSAGMTVDRAYAALKEGDDLLINGAHLGGLQNAVKEMGSGIDPAIGAQFQVLESLSRIAENSTGIFKENFGAPENASKLVGVKRMQEQQANIMMQPLLDAVQTLFEQDHRHSAQVGREWYAHFPWILEDLVGTEGAAILIAAKNVQLSQVRVQVTISMDAQETMDSTDQMILGMLQLPVPLLDDVAAGELLGHSYPEDVYAKVREFTTTRRQQQVEAAQAQQETQAAAAMEAENQIAAERESELFDKTVNAAVEMEKVNQKANQPNVQALSEHAKPDATMAM